MSKYKIAGLTVEMEPKYDILKKQSLPYLGDDINDVDFCIDISEESIIKKAEQMKSLTVAECEYSWFGYVFYRNLLNYNGMLLHSSCVSLDGSAYLFSAPSGTGKSTHTALWKKHFGDRLVYVNDDKPALRIFADRVFACGTPFSGKTDLNTNISVPLKGICILSRGEKNTICEADPKKAIHKILNQSYRPTDIELMNKTLDILNVIMSNVPVYDFSCNISDDAVITAYEFMNR